MDNFKNKKILVMGLGLIGGGVGVVKWLIKQGAKVTVTDLKTKKELKPSLNKLKGLPIKYILSRHRLSDFKKADLIIKNPGVPNDSPFLKIARKNKIPVETDLSLFFKYWPGQIIGVTGTKGKSTTTSLIYEILKSAGLPVKIAGNIGQTPLQYLNAKMLKCSNNIMILEISSFQLENLKVSPQIAVITNIFPDHLNRYKNMEEYIAAKERIFKYQKPKDLVVLNYDNQILKKISQKIRNQIVWFSQKTIPPIRANKGIVIFSQNQAVFSKRNWEKQKICTLSKIKLIGRHNLENILAAIAVAQIFKIKPKIIQKVLKNFKGIANRLELIKTIKGVKYYNDTAATIPEATIAALKSLSSIRHQTLQKQGKLPTGQTRIILIAGGSNKKLKFDKLVKLVKKTCKAIILLPGIATPNLKSLIIKYKFTGPLLEINNMREAINQAKKIAKRGDIILLSPACASFGLFKNEFDRGRQFKKWVID